MVREALDRRRAALTRGWRTTIQEDVLRYDKPAVIDYGTLLELTEASFRFGPEDGASKIDTVNHHSLPTLP